MSLLGVLGSHTKNACLFLQQERTIMSIRRGDLKARCVSLHSWLYCAHTVWNVSLTKTCLSSRHTECHLTKGPLPTLHPQMSHPPSHPLSHHPPIYFQYCAPAHGPALTLLFNTAVLTKAVHAFLKEPFSISDVDGFQHYDHSSASEIL